MGKGFDFGSNWKLFSQKRGSLERLEDIRKSLQSLLAQRTIEEKSFLDVGCGSGLFSIAAHQLRATRVVGIDCDPVCIDVSNNNRVRFAPQASISFQQMSVLQEESLVSLGHFDIVYAWGSLHHTGSMWTAIQNTARRVAPGGKLVLAIYNKHITSPLWQVIKRQYNRLPAGAQRLSALFFAGIIFIAKLLVTGRNPLTKERGMDFWHDVIDWVGGYPYEYATSREIETFVQPQGFILRRYVPARVPTGCNEFVFDRLTDPSHRECRPGPRGEDSQVKDGMC